MLLTADWVLPVDAAPIRHGAVVVHKGLIAAVGPAEALADAGAPRQDFPGCVLLPGLVNAHTHLSLTALLGLVPPTTFAEWIARLVPMMRAMDDDDMAASATLGALRCLQAGVTCVGDICYGPEAPASAADLGLSGVFFWEVLGIQARKLEAALEAAEFPVDDPVACGGRTLCGISPHSAYTSGPRLLKAEAEYARSRGLPLAIHVAESYAETQLLRDGSGALAPVAGRLAEGFLPPNQSPVAYLADLGVLDDALAVHCVNLMPGDTHLLAARARGVAVCPRSNAYLGNGEPPLARLVQAKATIGVGTDSAASNEDLDLVAEARALREIAPTVSASRLLRMLTLEGATALGLDRHIGSLTIGKHADIVAMRVPSTEQPADALLEHGGIDAVEAVMTTGTWRLRDRRPTINTAPLLRAAERATRHAKRVLLLDD